MGTTGTVSTRISARPEDVYALVSDVARMGEWSPETQAAEWLEGVTAPAVGARFRGTNKRRTSWKTTATVTVADPGREFAFAIGKKAPADPETMWRYTFEPAGDGTIVTESFEIVKEPGVVGKWFTRLGTGVPWDDRAADLEQGMRETLERLKEVAESATTSSVGP